MKKIIYAIVLTAAVMLVCTGCAQEMKDTAETMVSEAMDMAKEKATEIMSGEDGKTDDGDGFIEDETTYDRDDETDYTDDETDVDPDMNTEQTDNFV